MLPLKERPTPPKVVVCSLPVVSAESKVFVATEKTVELWKVAVEAKVAPPVKVRAPAEVNDEAPVGVRLTLPAPEAVKFPEVRVKAIGLPEVVIEAPAL